MQARRTRPTATSATRASDEGAMPKLKGIAKTRRRRKDGSFVEYHFAWRGGPCIWKTGDRHDVGDREYEAAYHRAHGRETEKALLVPARDIGQFREVIRAFLGSDDYRGYSDAHKRDLKVWIPRVEAEFGDTVIVAFNDPRIKRVAEAWRRGLAPREADKAKFTLSRLVRFAIEDESFGLEYNHIRSLKTRYKCDRSAIVWRPEEIAAFEKVAAEPLRRFFVMSVETGLRPGDLRRLTRNHIEDTEKGRRIFLRTSKRKRDVSIPVTARAAEIIDATPARQLLICASPTGLVWDAGNFGSVFRTARREARIRSELRLYDTRGTAATLLLHAGLGLDEIAVWMGWSLQYAGQMIATYARVDPDKTDATLVKLEPWLAQRAARMAAAK